MKRNLMALILALCLLGTSFAGAEGLLPSLADMIGKPMPSLGEALGRYPDEEIPGADGDSTEIFRGITAADYNTFSVYLSEKGATLADYQFAGTTFSAAIAVDGWTITFTYDTQTLEARVTYPKGTYDEYLAAHPESEAPADEEKLAPFRNVGGYVTFGSYEQDNNTANGKESIEWLVLDYDAANHRVLLLSRYGLDAKPYNTESVDITWENCTLRAWLNGEFMSTAFSTVEQGAILTTSVDNSSSQGHSVWHTDGGNNTQDKIFLLSYAEAKKYLGVNYDDSNTTKSRVSPTAYALEQNAWTSSDAKTADGAAAGWWWLRSPGHYQNHVAIVDADGSLSHLRVNRSRGCVRPALWINLESEENPAAHPEPKAPTSEEKRAPFRNVGGYVTFGNYEQDNYIANGKEPIEWQVLDYDPENNRALLISRYGLDVQPYNKEDVDVTWENCTLRAWLNGEFMNNAFSRTEQGAILTTMVDNSKKQGYGEWRTNGGNDTQDKIFLLSCAEAHLYFAVEYFTYYEKSRGNYDYTNATSRIRPTAYAIMNGADTNNDFKTNDGTAAGWWWLRSPGSSQHFAARVYNNGSLSSGYVDRTESCVRPALWINLESDIF